MDFMGIIKNAGPAVGYIVLFAIIFAESGLFIGFFLPGDSILFPAGFLASQGFFSLPELVIICAIAAILGDSVGYMFGRRVGRRLFLREDSTFFKKKHLEAAEAFYEKHGSKTIVLARFVPIVRTFAPIVAGISDMHYRRFVTFNIIGGALWAGGVTIAGYLLGHLIPAENVDKLLIPIIILLVIIPGLPSIIHVLRDEEMRTSIMNMPRNLMRSRKSDTAAPTTLEADKTE
jgi:membrane-associated protein